MQEETVEDIRHQKNGSFFSPSLSIQRGIEFESRTRAAHHFCLKNHISLEWSLLHQIDQNRSIHEIDFASMKCFLGDIFLRR